jgi:DNA-binding HxlR family transcriptional regulator
LRILGNGKLSGSLQSDCPATREILNLVGGKWSTLVVVFLGHGAQRFNALKRASEGISQRVLTSTLRRLEREGIVERTVRRTNPPQVEYALTKLGQSLLTPVTVLASWAQGHRAEVLHARDAFDGKRKLGAGGWGVGPPRPVGAQKPPTES